MLEFYLGSGRGLGVFWVCGVGLSGVAKGGFRGMVVFRWISNEFEKKLKINTTCFVCLKFACLSKKNHYVRTNKSSFILHMFLETHLPLYYLHRFSSFPYLSWKHINLSTRKYGSISAKSTTEFVK